MKLYVKDVEITTGGTLIVILNQKDSCILDLHPLDRVLIKHNKHKTIAVLDITTNPHTVPEGYIGVFEEVISKLNVKSGDEVEISFAKKPQSVQYIKEKLDGKTLTDTQIDAIVHDIVHDELTESEVSYFVAASYTHTMSDMETVALTKSIVKHGGSVTIGNKSILDKHCTGGVAGNRTTMCLVPIIIAAGLTMPKTSSRSITSPAGTADTMEVLAPVTLSTQKMSQIAKRVGGFIAWGGGANLASADDKLIRVRQALCLDPEAMLLSSILAKKAAVHATHVLIDIPIGPHTKIKTYKDALHLKAHFVKLGKMLGMTCHVLITDGSQPIGNGIGPALEARDALYILRRDPRQPRDLETKVLMMATTLLKIAGKKNPSQLAKHILESGAAYTKMQEIIKAQGGEAHIHPTSIPLGPYTQSIKAPRRGTITMINNEIISHIARIAGAPTDKGAGIYLHKHVGDNVSKGEPIFTIYAHTKHKLEFAYSINSHMPAVLINKKPSVEIRFDRLVHE
ncbi:MAG: AMP phosphorylase [Nanoarchaeota archaeon]